MLSCVRALIVVSLQKALSHNRGYATDPSLAGPLVASPPHRVPISLIAGEEWEVLGRPRARIDEMRQAQRHESMFQMRLAMPRRCVPPPFPPHAHGVLCRFSGFMGANGVSRPIAAEREVQEQQAVDMYLRMAKEEADRNFLSCRQAIERGRECDERYNGDGPSMSPLTAPTRHTRLDSRSRKVSHQVPFHIKFPEYSSDRSTQSRWEPHQSRHMFHNSDSWPSEPCHSSSFKLHQLL